MADLPSIPAKTRGRPRKVAVAQAMAIPPVKDAAVKNAPIDAAAPKSQPVAKTSPKVETPKVETPKVEAPKVDAPKVEARKVEAPKPAAPKAEVRKPEPAKAAAPVKQSAPAPAVAVAKAAPAVVETAKKITEQKVEAAPSPAVRSDKSLAEAIALPAAVQGSMIMATVDMGADKFGAEKAQAVLGDMQARFKTAWEKSSKLGEDMVEFTKGNVEAVVASAKVAQKHGEELGQEAVDYSKKSFEGAMTLFRSLASAKSPTELFQLQSDFAKSSFDGAIAEASKVSEKLLKIAGEVAQPISSRYAVAAEKIKTTTF